MVLLLMTLGGCKEEIPPIITPANESIDQVSSKVTLDDFFSLTSKIVFTIEIDEKELALINNDNEEYDRNGSKSPIYRKCNLSIKVNEESFYFYEVGIRMKGNTSRTSFYQTETGIYNLIHYKLSFSETFDKIDYYQEIKTWENDELRQARKERTFLGMEKLDLKWNKSYDHTYAREAFASDMYHHFGLLAPHSTIGQVKINYQGSAENLGVFMVQECVDKAFLARNLSNDAISGDLYKCGWGTAQGANLTTAVNAIGIEDENKGYFPTYDLKTNKKKSDHHALVNLIETLNQKTASELASVIDDIVDMDYFVMFEAISYLLGSPDDMRNHYNNYYIYFKSDTNQAIFIPYDTDRLLGTTKDWNPSGDAMIGYEPLDIRTTIGNNEPQLNPLYNKTILDDDITKYQKLFKEALQTINSDGFFSYDNYKTYYEKIYNNYHDLIIPSIPSIADKYARINIFESTDTTNTSQNVSVQYYINRKNNILLKYLNNN